MTTNILEKMKSSKKVSSKRVKPKLEKENKALPVRRWPRGGSIGA